MSPKQKRRRTKKPNKVPKYCRQWNDLPEYLHKLIHSRSVVISSGGIWKSLRPTSKPCLYLNNSTKLIPYLVELPDFRSWNSSNVFTVQSDLSTRSYPSTCAVHIPSGHFDLRPTIIVFTGIRHPVFLFTARRSYLQQSLEWIKQDCRIVDPNAPIAPHEKKSAYLQFSSAIEFKGKVYALSLYGTITVIEVTDSCPSITSIGKFRAFPSLPLRHFKEYLLRSEEGILLVFLVSKRSTNIVDDVEIFRLNCDTLSLDKVHSLGDRAVIVGADYCIVASSVEARCKRNCVYFHHRGSNDTWWMFDMESHQISCLENIEDV